MMTIMIPLALTGCRRLVVTVVLGLATGTAFSQAPAPDDEAIDEVIVRGERRPIVIRRELNEARDIAIDIYNELNDDERFDVLCDKVAEIGTQLKQRRCRLRIDLDDEATRAENYEFGFGLFGGRQSRYYDEFVSRIMRLANENPELLEQLDRTKRLNLELIQAKGGAGQDDGKQDR